MSGVGPDLIEAVLDAPAGVEWCDRAYRTMQRTTLDRLHEQARRCMQTLSEALTVAQSTRSALGVETDVEHASNVVSDAKDAKDRTEQRVKEVMGASPRADSHGTKIDALVDAIKALPSGDKCLVFSAYAENLKLVAQALKKNNIDFVGLKGARKVAAQQFVSDSSKRAFLLSAGTSAAGLNLTVATTVFFTEPLLNPTLEMQAAGRVFRIGQTRPTKVVSFVVSDSVEEHIHSLMQAKKARISADPSLDESDDFQMVHKESFVLGDVNAIFRLGVDLAST